MVFGWGFIGAGGGSKEKEKGLSTIPEKDKPNQQSQESEMARHRGPTLSLLPFALYSCAMSFFMFSVQVHEKSILLPLMPITLLLAARESESEVDSGAEGAGLGLGMGLGGVWEWGVLVNNVAVFR